MAYQRTNWVQDTTVVSAARMNNIEEGILANESDIDTLETLTGDTTLPTTAQTITGAIAEHETDITNVRTTANGSVRFNKAQSIGSAAKAQARHNINAASEESVNTLNNNVLKCVKYTSQTLTNAQQEQARTNIGAARISVSGHALIIDTGGAS